jgi:hypothetical protein
LSVRLRLDLLPLELKALLSLVLGFENSLQGQTRGISLEDVTQPGVNLRVQRIQFVSKLTLNGVDRITSHQIKGVEDVRLLFGKKLTTFSVLSMQRAQSTHEINCFGDLY